MNPVRGADSRSDGGNFHGTIVEARESVRLVTVALPNVMRAYLHSDSQSSASGSMFTNVVK